MARERLDAPGPRLHTILCLFGILERLVAASQVLACGALMLSGNLLVLTGFSSSLFRCLSSCLRV